MPNGSITIYKLIILYTLSKVDSPLPPGVISDYITDRGYTNYFNLQNAFGELLEADLIKEDSTYHLTYYTLTEAGAETLELFGAPLSREIRDEINHYLEEHKFEIIDDTSLVSDYHATNDGTYLATCTLRDGNHVLSSCLWTLLRKQMLSKYAKTGSRKVISSIRLPCKIFFLKLV